MNPGDLIKITTEGKYYGYGLPVPGGCAEISGMLGIYLGQPIYPHEDGLTTAIIMLSNGWICDIFEPHANLEVISESR